MVLCILPGFEFTFINCLGRSINNADERAHALARKPPHCEHATHRHTLCGTQSVCVCGRKSLMFCVSCGSVS